MIRTLFLFGAALFALAWWRPSAVDVQPRPADRQKTDASAVPREFLASAEPDVPRLTVTRVVQVIDGDTVILEDGTRVRYIGIDTPEMTDARRVSAADAARAANKALVGGRGVRLEFDVQRIDRYGRTLAYVWIGGTLVNETLLRDGWARLLTIPPNVRYVDRLRVAARAGDVQRLLLWSPGTPAPGRVLNSMRGQSADCPAGKSVKGNINRRGEKIFHVPGGAFYDRTRPEECFRDPGDAERAGYRASQR